MTEQPLTDDRCKRLRDILLTLVAGLMDEGFSPFQIGTMMAALSVRVIHEAGHVDAVDAVVAQLRKTAADAGHVGMQ